MTKIQYYAHRRALEKEKIKKSPFAEVITELKSKNEGIKEGFKALKIVKELKEQ